ncbi:MAG: formylglycine-generating enzyme family protein [Nitrospinota bacterium]
MVLEFQAELIATAHILKSPAGYMLTLNIFNVLEDEIVLSEVKPCRGCDEFQMIDQLTMMAGGKPSAPIARAQIPQPQASTSVPPKPKPESPPEGMIFVKGGCFEMGNTFGDAGRREKPVHLVCLDDFFMDKYEVTNAQYEQFRPEFKLSRKQKSGIFGGKIKISPGDNNPVIMVTWYESKVYCGKVGKHLPTEAEWEYAARSGGKKEKYAGTSSNIDNYAWYESNSGGMTQPVGIKNPNGLGLYDMTGNVWEWVSDWHDVDYYSNSPTDNPKGASIGNQRVYRGGSWKHDERSVRASYRNVGKPAGRTYYLGFRCAK